MESLRGRLQELEKKHVERMGQLREETNDHIGELLRIISKNDEYNRKRCNEMKANAKEHERKLKKQFDEREAIMARQIRDLKLDKEHLLLQMNYLLISRSREPYSLGS